VSAASVAAIGAGAAKGDARRIGILFMVGSACFAAASLPAASKVSDQAVGVVYFVGSVFFTTERLARDLDDPGRGALLPLGGADPGEAATVAAAVEAWRGGGSGRVLVAQAAAPSDEAPSPRTTSKVPVSSENRASPAAFASSTTARATLAATSRLKTEGMM
jgi:hypothetical protein